MTILIKFVVACKMNCACNDYRRQDEGKKKKRKKKAGLARERELLVARRFDWWLVEALVAHDGAMWFLEEKFVVKRKKFVVATLNVRVDG
jgi:hypothetical protein